jgi:NAD(P)-dependent dehydrogenase (short-subunit alcohol dehydrogenase family)
MSVEDRLNLMDIQLTTSFRFARTFNDEMVEDAWDRIIHITTPDGFVGFANRAHSIVAKRAQRPLTRSLAVEFGPHGSTTNHVAPGTIDTDPKELRHPHVTADEPRRAPEESDRSTYVSEIPVGRLGTPLDAAHARVPGLAGRWPFRRHGYDRADGHWSRALRSREGST